jgi:vacuolar-type H+-ATPase subunit E/Vma4
MNTSEVHNQISQMQMFILQEARDKAEEILTKTEQEFMADKLLIETNRT